MRVAGSPGAQRRSLVHPFTQSRYRTSRLDVGNTKAVPMPNSRVTHDEPPLAYKQESIAIAGAADLLIRSLLDRQQFNDPGGEAEALGISSAAWPLFGLLWPSGLRLAETMMIGIAVKPAARILDATSHPFMSSIVMSSRIASG